MKEYIPTPVDTQSISLPKELNSLVEEMSKNVHEVWSAGMEKSAMMLRRSILALCLMRSYQRKRRNMTVTLRLKQLNSF